MTNDEGKNTKHLESSTELLFVTHLCTCIIYFPHSIVMLGKVGRLYHLMRNIEEAFSVHNGPLSFIYTY